MCSLVLDWLGIAEPIKDTICTKLTQLIQSSHSFESGAHVVVTLRSPYSWFPEA